MTVIAGDATDGVRTGLAGSIANDIAAAIPGTSYPAGTNHQKGMNAIAQGIVDAVNATKWDGTTQVSGGGGGGGWSTAYDVDLTTQSTQDFKAGGDGNYTIDGKTWSTINGAGATTLKLTNGTGVVLQCNGVNAPGFFTKLTNLVSSIMPVGEQDVEVWGRCISANLDANSEDTVMLVGDLSSYAARTNLYVLHGPRFNSGDGNLHWFTSSGPQGVLYRSFQSLTDDVWVTRITSSGAMQCFSGIYSGGWPSAQSLRFRGSPQTMATATGSGFFTYVSQLVSDLGVHFEAFGDTAGNNSKLTITNLRLRVRA